MTLLTSLSAALMPCAAARADDAPAAASASAAESAPDAAGNTAEKPAFTIEVQTANEELKTLLERHNDLRRYQSVPDLDAAELDRLMALAESGLKGLLAAQGYFSPQITLTRQAAAKGQPPVVRIAVEPGEQAMVAAADIAFAGDIAHSADPAAAEQQKAIREDWALGAGKSFTQEAWSSAKSGALRQLIAKRYPAGRMGRSQADVDEAARSVKLGVTLDSGPLYRLGPVQVTGNRRYPAFLPGRLAQLAVGEPYDQARLADAQQRLISSGYYDAYYIKAQKARAFIKSEYEEILKDADLIFMPIAPGVAYKFGELSDPLRAYLSDIYTIGVNVAGLPAISVPVAKNKEALNISAQLIGRAYDEQTVLDGGLSLEKIVKG